VIAFLADTTSSTQQANPLVGLAPLLLIGLALYFLMIRPQQKRMKGQRALLAEIQEGDEIMTTSGIFGTITDIDEDTDLLTVEIAPGVSVRMIRGGVSRRITEDDYDEADEEDDSQAGEGADADR
jgi:preprotein translocase, YajC subunit